MQSTALENMKTPMTLQGHTNYDSKSVYADILKVLHLVFLPNLDRRIYLFARYLRSDEDKILSEL